MRVDRFFYRIWIVWGLFSITFILAAFLFYSNHKSNELDTFFTNSQLELNFLKKAVKNTLQKGNYQDSIQLINEWGELNTNICAIELVSENGFTIAQYQRHTPADKTIVNSVMIEYSYRGNAKLQIIHDLYPVYLQIEHFALKLGMVTFIGIFTSLIFVNQFILLHRRNSALNVESRRLAAAQLELGKSEQLLQNVIVGANLGFWDWYYQTGELRESDLLLSILGLTRSDIENNINDCFKRIHLDDLDRVHQVVETAIEQDVPYRVEFRI
ncbi:MAG: PAS domain-containing protein [Gammaproteobacteria bacterium]|nr:PAS domain-containing protein [Gammaproteobacteria bacterium]